MSTLSSSSCCGRVGCRQHRLQRAATASTAAVPAARHRSLQCVTAQLQQSCIQLQQHQQQLPPLVAPRPPQQLLQQQEQHWPQQLQGGMSEQQSRCSVIAAAGRRRRQDVGAEEGDPDLDIDDVMYAGDAEVDDADGLEVDADVDDDLDDLDEEGEEEDEEGSDELDDEDLDDAAQGDDWAAALENFDTSLDAQVAAAPSEEEQELAAARSLVGYNEAAGERDGTTLIVSEVPPEEPDRPKTFDEQTTALSAQDKATLEQNMAAYTVFPMHELDLLVSSTPDGQLVLSDCFCLDTVEDSFVRPLMAEGLPSQPSLYQIIPWEHTKTGDLLKHKEPEVHRMKLYFVGLTGASQDVDMSRVYSFDTETMQMELLTPQVLGSGSYEDMLDPVLRIRADGVWIEEAEELPGTYFIAEGFSGHPMDRYNNPEKPFNLHEFVKMGLWDKPRDMEELRALEAGGTAVATATKAAAGAEEGVAMSTAEESQLEERLEELELMEELDDMPDVPAVDMM